MLAQQSQMRLQGGEPVFRGEFGEGRHVGRAGAERR
jgi:hypothetical protein